FVEGTVATAAGQSNKDSVIVYEKGANDTFEVSLQGDTDPASPVTVTADPNTVGFTSAEDIILTSASTPINTAGNTLDLTFTQVNVPQTVTVSAVEDSPLEEGIEYARISFTLTGDGAYADGFIAPVDITIVDADSASIITDLEGYLVLTEGDTVGQSFTVKLGSAPTDDVTIAFDNVADPNEVSIDPESITFTPENYDTLQTVTVVAVDNDVLVGVGTIENPAIERTKIDFIILSKDLAYSAMPTPFIYGDIYDDECGAWGYNQMDFDQDCYVDMVDFATFANQWLASTDPKNP
ncbi:MAG: hypothetical protein KAS23_12925, partial [Anaerohalosphaera sp.]|nr:hypothetical protein [Anaerohalosphaera sp.]